MVVTSICRGIYADKPSNCESIDGTNLLPSVQIKNEINMKKFAIVLSLTDVTLYSYKRSEMHF